MNLGLFVLVVFVGAFFLRWYVCRTKLARKNILSRHEFSHEKISEIFPDFLEPSFKNEKAAQRVSFGAGYPADVHADIPADVWGQKLRSSPRNPGKTSILVRTSTSRRHRRPWPEGVSKKLRSEKLRAEFSFPIPFVRKVPAKFPAKLPCKKSRKIHRCSAGAHGEISCITHNIF